MKFFLTPTLLVMVLCLGGCLNIKAGQQMDPEEGSGVNTYSWPAILQNTLKHKYEYKIEINNQFQTELFDLRARLESHKITHEEYLKEEAEIRARNSMRLNEMEREYGAALNDQRSINCHTSARKTICD